jgi:hypothetical protein
MYPLPLVEFYFWGFWTARGEEGKEGGINFVASRRR